MTRLFGATPPPSKTDPTAVAAVAGVSSAVRREGTGPAVEFFIRGVKM